MAILCQNGSTEITLVDKKSFILDGVSYDIPDEITAVGYYLAIIKGRILINDYEFITKKQEFKKTIRSRWHYFLKNKKKGASFEKHPLS